VGQSQYPAAPSWILQLSSVSLSPDALNPHIVYLHCTLQLTTPQNSQISTQYKSLLQNSHPKVRTWMNSGYLKTCIQKKNSTGPCTFFLSCFLNLKELFQCCINAHVLGWFILLFPPTKQRALIQNMRDYTFLAQKKTQPIDVVGLSLSQESPSREQKTILFYICAFWECKMQVHNLL
jgi:hypothetical protein